MPANQPFWGEVVNNGATYWDLIIIADLEFVGFATVTGGVSRDIQVNKPKGADGATITDNGYKLANISITLKLVQQVDWDSFQNDLLPTIHPRRKGGPRTPVILTHPAMNVLGISRIYFTSIGAPVIGSDKIGTVKLDAIEWAPAPKPVKKAAGKGKTSPAAGNAGVPPGFDAVYGDPGVCVLSGGPDEDACINEGATRYALEGIGF